MTKKSTRYPMLWAVTNSRYQLTVAMPSKANPGTFYLPELKREATLGTDLFERARDAEIAATKNVERLAAEAGIPVSEMAVRLRDADQAARVGAA